MISFRKQSRPNSSSSSELAVVRLAVVDVEVERPVLAQQPPCLAQARLEEAEIVGVRIEVAAARDLLGAVAGATEAGAVSVRVAGRDEREPTLLLARIEGRVDVDERERLGGQPCEQLEVVAEVDPLAEHALSVGARSEHGRGRHRCTGRGAHLTAAKVPRRRRYSRRVTLAPLSSGGAPPTSRGVGRTALFRSAR